VKQPNYQVPSMVTLLSRRLTELVLSSRHSVVTTWFPLPILRAVI